jgi:hypothetical protein
VAPSGDRYSEDEVGLILQRAAELQKRELKPGDSQSMSLQEIEHVAAEAGLRRGLVRRAAAEIAQPTAQVMKRSAVLGGPREIALERVIEGEFPVDKFDLLVEAIRVSLGEIGNPQVLGRTLTWSTAPGDAPHGLSPVFVAVNVRDGTTRIRVHQKLAQLVGALYGGVMGGLGGGGTGLPILIPLALGVPVLIPFACLAWYGGVFALTRGLYARASRRRERSLQRLMEELVTVAEAEIGGRRTGRA